MDAHTDAAAAHPLMMVGSGPADHACGPDLVAAGAPWGEVPR